MGPASGRLAQLTTPARRAGQLGHGVGERGGVRLHGETGAAVVDEIDQAAAGGADHRQAGGHRLEGGDAECLGGRRLAGGQAHLVRRHDGDAGGGERRSGVHQPSREAHPPAQPELIAQCFQGGPALPVPHDGERRVGREPAEGHGERLEHHRVVAVLLEPTDGDEPDRSGSGHGAAGRCRHGDAMGHDRDSTGNPIGGGSRRRDRQVDPLVDDRPADPTGDPACPGPGLVGQGEKMARLDDRPPDQGTHGHGGGRRVAEVGVHEVEAAGQAGQAGQGGGLPPPLEVERVDGDATGAQGGDEPAAPVRAGDLRLDAEPPQGGGQLDDVPLGARELGGGDHLEDAHVSALRLVRAGTWHGGAGPAGACPAGSRSRWPRTRSSRTAGSRAGRARGR
jgi:hypothetical protein